MIPVSSAGRFHSHAPTRGTHSRGLPPLGYWQKLLRTFAAPEVDGSGPALTEWLPPVARRNLAPDVFQILVIIFEAMRAVGRTLRVAEARNDLSRLAREEFGRMLERRHIDQSRFAPKVNHRHQADDDSQQARHRRCRT